MPHGKLFIRSSDILFSQFTIFYDPLKTKFSLYVCVILFNFIIFCSTVVSFNAYAVFEYNFSPFFVPSGNTPLCLVFA